MKFTAQHKALAISLLIGGSVLVGLFGLQLREFPEIQTESYYEINPEEFLKEQKPEEQIAENEQEQSKSETNKAYNETQQYNRFAQAYTPIEPPKDYVPAKQSQSDEAMEEPTDDDVQEVSDMVSQNESNYSKVNDILKKRHTNQQAAMSNGDNSSDKAGMNASANTNSSMHYSLTGRTHEYIPTPIYLCEASGKIVVNITVNAKGVVTDTYVNSSSTSKNQCLIDSALEYAKEARFNADVSKPSQIGSITFYFEGKR